MRKITKITMETFLNSGYMSLQNMRVSDDIVSLHNNDIIKRENGNIFFNLAGWNTVTTRERINGLCEILNLDIRVKQKQGEPYIINFITNEKEKISIFKWYKIEF